MGKRRGAALLAAAGIVSGLLIAPPSAHADDPGDDAAPVVVETRFTTSDGVELQTTLTSVGPVTSKPTVVEFSPYGRGSQTLSVTDDYNFLLVQIRGTGDSDGSFDALGPKTQSDVVEVLRWACDQPFSDGNLALNGFSASAITLYNSWHQELPCVKAAILKSGTHELYRDLLVPGGITNLLPGAGVIAMIGAPAALQGIDRLQRDPASSLDVIGGLFTSGMSVLAHPSLDGWWAERGWRGDANDIPVLVINGFFDVESRGAFQAYQALREDGAHMVLEGGHDGVPSNSDGGVGEAHAWLDHYVRGVDNGVEDSPRVSMLIANGSRPAYLEGQNVRVDASDWPVPGTRWDELYLNPDKSLSATPSAQAGTASYLSLTSLPTMSDVPTMALIDAAGAKALTGALPMLSQTDYVGINGLTSLDFTTEALAADVDLVGPVSLELPLSTTTPGSGIWAILSDVAPDGTTNPLTVGRLSTSYPDVIEDKSLRDENGEIVQPYGDYTTPRPATPGAFRDYRVELWPVGNRFAAGHKLRLQLVGTSLASPLVLPGLHTVKLGGPDGARLRVPVLPSGEATPEPEPSPEPTPGPEPAPDPEPTPQAASQSAPAPSTVTARFAPRKGVARVRVASAGTPGGKVVVYDGKRRLARGVVDNRGIAKVRLPRLRPGQHRLWVVYRGSSTTLPASSPRTTVRIR